MGIKTAMAIAMFTLSLAAIGCDSSPNPIAPATGAPFIDSLAAIPSTIMVGDSTVIIWSVRGSLSTLYLEDDQGHSSDVHGVTRMVVRPLDDATYQLTARNDHGSSTARVAVSVSNPGDPGSPPAPFTLSAFDEEYANVARFVGLLWTGSSLAQHYLVERRSPGTAYQQVGTSYRPTYGATGLVEFEDGALPPASAYYYRVRSVSASGAKSKYSNEAAVVTLGTPISIDSVIVNPPTSPILAPGSTFFLQARAYWPGASFGVRLTPTVYLWASSNPGVAMVDGMGLVTAGTTSGTTQISAKLQGVTSNIVNVEVGPAGTLVRQMVAEYWMRSGGS